MNEENKELLIQSLRECVEACNHCYNACLEEEDVKMMVKCIRLDRECADICNFVETSIHRNSAYLDALLKMCQTVCMDCGNECKNHHHEHCQKCAEACFKCAEICKTV